MFDIMAEPGTSKWAIIHRQGEGLVRLVTSADLERADAPERIRLALRIAYNRGRVAEAAARAAAFNGLLGDAPLASR